MNTPKTPPAPDTVATAAAQGAVNKDTAVTQAELNMINQTDAYGNKLTYNPIGNSASGNPRYESTVTLSPEQRALADKLTALTGQSYDTAGTLFNNVQSQLGTGAPQYDDNYRQQQLGAILSRTQGERDRQRAALETQLANAGATIGSQAYNDAMGQYQSGQNDYLLGADLASGNEARAQYGTQLGGRTQAINELTGLLGLGQVQGFSPQQTPQTGVAPTDITGPTMMAYQAQLANSQRPNAALGALSGLGGAALGGWGSGGFKKFW
jgi:hypothetical protein